ncbi:MAG TPA: hypothetical protein VM452_14645 [Caulifigura sp.]|nr:hypothetical protein [Caulifigura sp.]
MTASSFVVLAVKFAPSLEPERTESPVGVPLGTSPAAAGGQV